MEEKGICMSCGNEKECMYIKPDSVIFECEERDAEIKKGSKKRKKNTKK